MALCYAIGASDVLSQFHRICRCTFHGPWNRAGAPTFARRPAGHCQEPRYWLEPTQYLCCCSRSAACQARRDPCTSCRGSSLCRLRRRVYDLVCVHSRRYIRWKHQCHSEPRRRGLECEQSGSNAWLELSNLTGEKLAVSPPGILRPNWIRSNAFLYRFSPTEKSPVTHRDS
jgi:hypothetical protein